MTTKIYNKVLLTKELVIDFKNINVDFLKTIKDMMVTKFEGKCITEGFIKPSSINIVNYSVGELYADKITTNIVFECLVVNPVESNIIECKVNSITKVGIRAQVNNDIDNPLVIFVARDHHYNNEIFSSIKEEDIIYVRVIGKRFEIYDTYISVIGEIVNLSDLKPKSEGIKSKLHKKIKT